MKVVSVTVPQLGLFAATRAMFGAGIALLIADRLNDDQRRTVGITLAAIGALSTIPLALTLLMRDRRERRNLEPASTDAEIARERTERSAIGMP